MEQHSELKEATTYNYFYFFDSIYKSWPLSNSKNDEKDIYIWVSQRP